MVNKFKKQTETENRKSLGNDDLMKLHPQINSKPIPSVPVVQPSTSKNAGQNISSNEPFKHTLDVNDFRDYHFDDDFKNALPVNPKEKNSRSKMEKKKRKKKQNPGKKSSQKRKRTSVYSSGGFLMGTSSESDDSSFIDDDRSEENYFPLLKTLKIKNKPMKAVIRKVDKNWEQLKMPNAGDLYDPEIFDEQIWLKKYNIKKCEIKLKKLNLKPNFTGTVRIIKKSKKLKNQISKICNDFQESTVTRKFEIPNDKISIKNNSILSQKVAIKKEPTLIIKTPEKTPLGEEIKRKLLAEDDDLPDLESDLDFIVKRPSNKKENDNSKLSIPASSGENSTKSFGSYQKQRLFKEKVTN